MARVIIVRLLEEEIQRKFKEESKKIFLLIKSLENNPQKGKSLLHYERFVLKELKYKKFRFYFVTDGFVLKFGTKNELASLLIKFIKMSEKKDQQKVIDSIKEVLKSFGFEHF